MLVRNGFITNSSSCSFIAWGFEIDRKKVNDVAENTLSDDEYDDFWDDMYNGEFPVSIKTCGYSGRSWAVATESLYSSIEDERYVKLAPETNPEWYQHLAEWCDKYGIERGDPCWFFATVGC